MCAACAACLAHSAAETGSQLLGLFRREAAAKAVVKHEQEGFGTAQFMVFIKIFSPLPDKLDYFLVLQGCIIMY
jgi:hypothetical protein